MSAAGQTRAYAYVRGAPLPAPGSFQEQFLSEVIMRERNEKYLTVSLFAHLLARIGGLKADDITGLLEQYKEELYQFKYNYKYETWFEKKVTHETVHAETQGREMRRMFDKLDSMTVSSDSLRKQREEFAELDDDE